MDDALKRAIEFVPLMAKLIPVDCIIAVTDTEKILFGCSTFAFQTVEHTEGSPIPPESVNSKAMQQNRIVQADIPKEVLGIPFRTTGMPLKNSAHQIVGSILLGISLEEKDLLAETVSTAEEAIQQISSNSHVWGGAIGGGNEYSSAVRGNGRRATEKNG